MATVISWTTQAPDLAVTFDEFAEHLRARNRSPKTIRSYRDGVGRFAEFLLASRLPVEVEEITARHIEAFVRDQLARLKPASAANRFRTLQQYWRFLAERGYVEASPMARMRPPAIPEAPPPVLREADLTALFASAERRGKSFEARRDRAILAVLADTGCRAEGAGSLSTSDGVPPR